MQKSEAYFHYVYLVDGIMHRKWYAKKGNILRLCSHPEITSVIIIDIALTINLFILFTWQIIFTTALCQRQQTSMMESWKLSKKVCDNGSSFIFALLFSWRYDIMREKNTHMAWNGSIQHKLKLRCDGSMETCFLFYKAGSYVFIKAWDVRCAHWTQTWIECSCHVDSGLFQRCELRE